MLLEISPAPGCWPWPRTGAVVAMPEGTGLPGMADTQVQPWRLCTTVHN